MAFKVFVASSSEATELLNVVVTELPRVWVDTDADMHGTSSSPSIEVVAWNDKRVFQAGTTILSSLVDLPYTFDAAVFLFAADDARVRRGEDEQVPRDNVIFELGLFMSQLGPARCLILRDESADPPSDLAGLSEATISEQGMNGAALQRSTFLERVIRPQISSHLAVACRRWRHEGFSPLRLTRRESQVQQEANAVLGLQDAILQEAEVQRHASSILARHLFDKKSLQDAQDPLVFDWSSCVHAYLGGLAFVRRRLWAATWFHSRFWIGNSEELVRQNIDVGERLKGQGVPPPRRLFLLTKSVSDEIESIEQELIVARQQGERDIFTKRSNELKLFGQRVNELLRAGCEIRVTECPAEALHHLTDEMRSLTEYPALVIYDDDRVDIQEGGANGRIHLCAAFTPAMPTFDAVQRAATAFFETLWKDAQPIDSFLEKLRGARERVKNRIDYQPHWLAMYEFRLNEEDSQLRVVELNAIKQELNLSSRFGNIEAWLDIGTGTASLPLKLADTVKNDGVILCIDRDEDCVKFSKAIKKYDEQRKGDERIRIERADFLSTFDESTGRYDLITCGLGTISHFGADRNDQMQDGIQRALERMYDLLQPGGLLLVCTWSDAAVAAQRLLDIYLPNDARRLCDWSPKESEMKSRLARLNVSAEDKPIHERLVLWSVSKPLMRQRGVGDKVSKRRRKAIS